MVFQLTYGSESTLFPMCNKIFNIGYCVICGTSVTVPTPNCAKQSAKKINQLQVDRCLVGKLEGRNHAH